MRKAISTLILISIVAVFTPQPVAASAGFTLIGGQLDHLDSNSPSIASFWNNLRIEVTANGGDVFQAYGEMTVNVPRDSSTATYVCNGWVKGSYDPKTGVFEGEYQITDTSQASLDVKGRTPYDYTFTSVYTGTFSTIIKAGDQIASIRFKGSEDRKGSGIMPNGKPVEDSMIFVSTWGFTVAFQIEGEIGSIEIPTSNAITKIPDSSARFSDLGGEVEVCFPTGYDEDGNFMYNEEAWESAELEMELPLGTIIKAKPGSLVYLSFADMTSFIMKDGGQVILAAPAEKDGHLQLILGNIMLNVKKMMKDGSMEIETSQSVLGIKGTQLIVEDTGTQSTLKVIEGIVEVTSRSTGEVLMVNAGQTVIADQTGLSSVQTFNISDELSKWVEEKTNKQGSVGLLTTFFIISIIGISIFVVVGILVLIKHRRKVK
jgi:hypothetical protein